MALYQPLTLLDLVVYRREHANLNRVREVKCLYPYHTIITDVKKATLAMFLNEIINKTIKEESHSSELFEFLAHAFMALDQQERGYENFHLIFLLKLCRYLGFGARQASELFTCQIVAAEEEHILNTLLKASYDTLVPMSNMQRRSMLDILLNFYTRHIDTLGEIRSVQVLREVLI